MFAAIRQPIGTKRCGVINGGVAPLPPAPPTTAIYWGWGTDLFLTPEQIVALPGTINDTDEYGTRTFPAATVYDYAFFWWPDSFPMLATNPNGFKLGAFGVAMATNTEGFTSGPESGYYWLPRTIGGVSGRLYRSFYQIGGPGSQDIVVA